MIEPTPDNLKTILDVNQNRQKHLERFVNAFLAAKAPPDFDFDWVMENVTLCHSQMLHNGAWVDKVWIELNPTGRRR